MHLKDLFYTYFLSFIMEIFPIVLISYVWCFFELTFAIVLLVLRLTTIFKLLVYMKTEFLTFLIVKN